MGRKLPRADKKTDLLVICYSPLLDWSVADKSLSEGYTLIWTNTANIQHLEFM